MDVKQALDFLRETHRDCINNTYSKEFALAVETLTRALEWQPMETMPLERGVFIKVMDQKNPMIATWYFPENNYVELEWWDNTAFDENGDAFTLPLDQIIGWKEVE